MRFITLARSLIAALSITATFGIGVAHANNVEVSIRGGSLYVYGDNNANELFVHSNAPGTITIEPYGSTSANGESAPVTLRGWTGGIYAYLYRGDDYLAIGLPKVDGAIHVDLGPGHDSMNIAYSPYGSTPLPVEEPLPVFGNSLQIKNHVSIYGAEGDDQVSLEDIEIRGTTTIDLGSGADHFGIWSWQSNNTFHNNVLILPGSGEDQTTIDSATFMRDLTVDDPLDAALIAVYYSRTLQNAFIFGSNKSDTISLIHFNAKHLLKILTKDGADQVYVGDTTADRLENFSGSGDDVLNVANSSFNKAWLYLENGNDAFYADTVDMGTAYFYAGAGNDIVVVDSSTATSAYLYGESGNDSFLGSNNTVNTLRVYSFEIAP